MFLGPTLLGRNHLNSFLKTNPGLRSRFPIISDCEDYSIDELLRIAQHILDRRQYRLSKEAEAKLGALLSQRLYKDRENFGNARLVRNLIERGIANFKAINARRDKTMRRIIELTPS